MSLLNNMPKANSLNWLWLSVVVIIFDQLTKYWAEYILREKVIVVFSWFDFSLVHNSGAAFGFLAGAGGWQHVFFVALAVVVSVMLVYFIRELKSYELQLAVAYALILGGAIGNVIDRLLYQYVVDFIHWFYNDWHWPHFNIADSAICIGAALLIAETVGWRFMNSKEHDIEKPAAKKSKRKTKAKKKVKPKKKTARKVKK